MLATENQFWALLALIDSGKEENFEIARRMSETFSNAGLKEWVNHEISAKKFKDFLTRYGHDVGISHIARMENFSKMTREFIKEKLKNESGHTIIRRRKGKF